MTPFAMSAQYYDLLYMDKDYIGEADYIRGLINEFCPHAESLLDIGCGTGVHAALFAGYGYDVVGVDGSEAMLARGRDQHPFLELYHGDARQVRLARKFDVVTSLFHVASYQTTNEDVVNYFATIAAHLAPGGLAIFDCWYGPGVLTDRPEVRVKRLEAPTVSVLRIAEPALQAEQNTVDVKYEIHVEDKAAGAHGVFHESHLMRYFFLPELEMFLANSGLKILAAHEWMSKRKPGFDCWNLTLVATAK